MGLECNGTQAKKALRVPEKSFGCQLQHFKIALLTVVLYCKLFDSAVIPEG